MVFRIFHIALDQETGRDDNSRRRARQGPSRKVRLKGEREGTAMTLRTNGLFRLNMAAPTGGCMTLSSTHADCLNVSAYLLRRGFGLAVAFIATCLLRMRPVLKIILAQCRSRTPRILQCKLCVGVTDSAFAQLLTGLVTVAAIALLMIRITGGRPLRRCMTGAAFRGLRLTGHFL